MSRVEEGIVNRWLFVRYLIVGMYVGIVTVAGSGWWYMFYEVRFSMPLDSICCASWHMVAPQQRRDTDMISPPTTGLPVHNIKHFLSLPLM